MEAPPPIRRAANNAWFQFVTDNVEIRDSLIPDGGKGAFLMTDVPAGSILALYEGEELTQQQLDARYGKQELGEYVLQLDMPAGVYIDARDTKHWTRFMNDGRDTPYSNNVKFLPDGRIQALKRIAAGEELLIGYSRQYWKQ